MAHANDNTINWKHLRTQRGGAWEQYDRIDMTVFGPIGIRNGEFIYLDQDTEQMRKMV